MKKLIILILAILLLIISTPVAIFTAIVNGLFTYFEKIFQMVRDYWENDKRK